MYADIFTTCTGIVSGPLAFLASKLQIILFIWSTLAASIFNSVAAENSYLIPIILGWFLNLTMIVAIFFSLTLLHR